MVSVKFWTEAQETKIVLAKALIKSVFVSGRIILLYNNLKKYKYYISKII